MVIDVLPYRVRLSPQIRSEVAHFAPMLKRKIKSALKVIGLNPFFGKPLLNELEDFWSYPVSHHRIIYTIEEQSKEVRVILIAPRPEVYELLLDQRRIKKFKFIN